jgi:DNA-binding response OmpR family regulator
MRVTAQKPFAGQRILIVEDEYFLADDLRRTLGKSGAEVLGPVPTVDQGLLVVDTSERIDLAVLDVHLHGENAFAISAALRRRGIPFLFATGYGDAEIPSEYRDVPRLEKPFEYAALIAALEAMIGRGNA